MACAVFVIDAFKFAQQFLLAIRQIDRRFHCHVAMQVTMGGAAHALNTLAAQAEDFSALGFGRNLDGCHAIQRRNFDRTTERSRAEADRHFTMQIIVVALEYRMRLGLNDYIYITGRPAIRTMFAFAGEADTVIVIDTGGNFY